MIISGPPRTFLIVTSAPPRTVPTDLGLSGVCFPPPLPPSAFDLLVVVALVLTCFLLGEFIQDPPMYTKLGKVKPIYICATRTSNPGIRVLLFGQQSSPYCWVGTQVVKYWHISGHRQRVSKIKRVEQTGDCRVSLTQLVIDLSRFEHH
jgi:hypothetical protein